MHCLELGLLTEFENVQLHFFFLLGCSNIQQLKRSGSVFVQINGGRNRRIRKPVYRIEKKTVNRFTGFVYMYIVHVLCASIDYTLCCYITAADSTTNPKCLYHYLCTRHSQADEVRSRYIFFPAFFDPLKSKFPSCEEGSPKSCHASSSDRRFP